MDERETIGFFFTRQGNGLRTLAIVTVIITVSMAVVTEVIRSYDIDICSFFGFHGSTSMCLHNQEMHWQ